MTTPVFTQMGRVPYVRPCGRGLISVSFEAFEPNLDSSGNTTGYIYDDFGNRVTQTPSGRYEGAVLI